MAADDLETSGYLAPEDGNWESAEPVSSILAAQLAPRFSSRGGHKHGLNRETFAQLRKELVQGKSSQLCLDDSMTDVCKLICIVLKAGLEYCSANDHAESESQILDCLAVIRIAIQKAPRALTECPEPESLGVNTQAPLYAWLIVQLLHLVSRWDSDIITETVTDLFSILACAQYKQTKTWNTSQATGLLRAYAAGLLAYKTSVGCPANRM